ncbi:SAM-dependent methyltransferase [Enterobacterales bacterium CwR94]|nr:SAM-dependent methyltransferase [Enterobacterales bacterium CwR94]
MTSSSHHDNINKQFGEQASLYLSSKVHAQGPDLQKLGECLSTLPNARVLDMGCGGGHASFAAAAQVAEVVAYDLSAQMLSVVAQAAKEKGIKNISTEQGYAEHLPFTDGEFDVVISRYSAHHWHDVGKAMREVKRVLKPGGKVIFMDVSAAGHPVLDIYLQTVEALRDTSHVRDYAPGEWLQMFTEAGLRINAVSQDRLVLEFGSWIARMRTPDALVQGIRAYQQTVSDEVRRYFDVQPDGSFTTDTIFIEATKTA